MITLAIAVLWLLIGLCILVGIGWVVLWVLGQLGIVVPPMAVKITLVILGLLCMIYALGLVAGGGPSYPYTGHRLSSSVPYEMDQFILSV